MSDIDLDSILNRAIQAGHEGMALLEHAKIELESVFENSPDVTLIFNGEGQILKANKAAEILCGIDYSLLTDYTLKQAFGTSFHNQIQESAFESFTKSAETQSTTSFEKNDLTLTYLWSTVLVKRDSPKSSFYLSMGKNITDITAYQQQLELTLMASRDLAAANTIPQIVSEVIKYLDRKVTFNIQEGSNFWYNQGKSYCRWTFEGKDHVMKLQSYPANTFAEMTANSHELEFGFFNTETKTYILPIQGMYINAPHFLTLKVDTQVFQDSHEISVYVQTLMQSVAISLDNVALMAEKEDAARLESAFLALATIQNGLLPPANILKGLDVDFLYQPAEKVGGDWLGYHQVANTSISVLYIADITGHGIPAAVITGTLCGASFSSRNILEKLYKINPEAQGMDKYLQLLAHSMNNVIRQTAQGEFLASMFIIAIDSESGEMWYLNAGHNLPLHYRRSDNKTKSLTCSGPQLGLKEDHEFEVRTSRIEKGDYLLMYTDGLLENSTKSGGPSISVRQLKKQMVDCDSAKSFIGKLNEQSSDLVPDDDVACLVLEVS